MLETKQNLETNKGYLDLVGTKISVYLMAAIKLLKLIIFNFQRIAFSGSFNKCQERFFMGLDGFWQWFKSACHGDR